MTAASTSTMIAADGTDRSRILRAGLIAVGGSVVANVLLLLILTPLLGLNTAFMPFTFGPIIFFTAVYTTGAVVLFWLLARFTKRPARIFTIVAVVGFIVTLFPNFALAANPAGAPMGGTSSDYLTLILFHIPPALITVWALTQQTRSR